MEIEVKMPDLSTTGGELTVLKWLVAVGDSVKRGDALFEVETDKSTMDVESAHAGVLKKQLVQPNATVLPGDAIAIIEVPQVKPAATAVTGTPPAVPNRQMADQPSESVSRVGPSIVPAFDPAQLRTGMFAENRAKRAVSKQAIPLCNTQRATDPRMLPAEISRDQLAAYDGDFLIELYTRMVRIREFEEGVKYLFLQGSMPGTIHQCQGQEATAVGVCAALRDDDFITSTFRGHGHALAKGLSVDEILLELYGAASGCCKGKGGSMHVGNYDKGMIPAIAIVGGGIPLAAGMALAFKMQKRDQVVACFFGDGATSEGAFHEGLTLAAIWDLPAIFVCENNLYGASTRVNKVTRLNDLAEHANSYGIAGRTVFGNDVLAVHEATKEAVNQCRRGQGPVLLELLTYRRTGHSRRDACNYQADIEKQSWFDRDPIRLLGDALTQHCDVDASQLEGIRDEIVAQFELAVERARSAPLPSENDLITDVFA
jgi:pyruvate dehydrogenase E1 component alpha subunit